MHPTYVQRNIGEERFRKRCFDIHQQRLADINTRAAQSTVISPTNSVVSETVRKNQDYIKQVKSVNKNFKQQEKNITVNRENQILLAKLVDISHGKQCSVTSGRTTNRTRSVGPSSLNINVRKKENERIERENHAFAKRLFDKPGCLSKRRMDIDYLQNLKYQSQIKKVKKRNLPGVNGRATQLPPLEMTARSSNQELDEENKYDEENENNGQWNDEGDEELLDEGNRMLENEERPESKSKIIRPAKKSSPEILHKGKYQEPAPIVTKKVTQMQKKQMEDKSVVKVGNHLKTYQELRGMPQFPPGTKSMLSKYLTRDIWNLYANAKDDFGYTFKQAIFSGCKNVDSGIGVYAGSADSYSRFSKLFRPIIDDYHKFKTGDEHQTNMNAKELKCPPFAEDEAKMIKSTRIRVGRNLDDFPLGPGLNKDQRLEVERTIISALSKLSGDLKGKYYPLKGMDADVQKELIENHFLFKEGDRFLEACGLNRDWPEGRGIYHNDDKTFLVWVNEEDQLRIISMESGSDIGAVFERLSRACAQIETKAEFAQSINFGYLTSCPTNLGTALRASVHIELPNLGQKKDEFQKIADQYHLQIRGAHGEHTETDQHVYDISNKRRLGKTEVQLIQGMYDGVKAMIQREKELAQQA